MIEIFPNRLEGRPIEKHVIETRMTIAEFLNQTMTGGYAAGEELPLSAWVNDERVPFQKWGEFVVLPSDRVRLHIEPRGTDPFSITYALFAGVKAVFGMLMPKLPGTPNSPLGQGDQLSQGSVRGNKIKLGDPVREVAGRMKIYPDYLVPPRKYFSAWDQQWTELGLCVGVGRFQILPGNVKIGETALLSLASDAEYRVFEPGEDVSTYSPFEWWHTAPEVGASSTGAAGLELTMTTDITPAPSASQFYFNGYSISIPSGAGAFPSDWQIGLVLRIVAPYTYTVTNGPGGTRDVITGPLGMLNPVAGQQIEVVGENEGLYSVFSFNGTELRLNYPDGSPAVQLALGTGLAAIGPRGLRFRILGITTNEIIVERLDADGESDPSFPGFDAGTLVGATVQIDSSNYSSGWRGPFAACPIGEETDRSELDFFFPEGLCKVSGKGAILSQTVAYEVQWRMVGESTWNPIAYGESGATLDQGGVTKLIQYGRFGRPEIRVRKQGVGQALPLESRDTIQWYALRSRLVPPSSYEGTTCIGLKVRSSDRISAQTESLVNVVATRILPLRQGGEGPTRSLADFAAYVPRSLGLDESRVNLEELYRLGAVWDARGDHFDHSYDSETTAQQALQDVFGAGFAELTLERGQITPVRDEPRSVFEQMYTPQNMVGYLKRTPKLVANPDEYDGVDVTFTDAATWSEATVPCRLPGDAGGKVEKITAPGITDRNKAYQLGMRRRRIQRFRPDSFEWQTEADALVSRYLSYCAVADDVSGYPQSALLQGYSASSAGVFIEVSEPLDWSQPGAYGVLLRRPDGSVSGAYPVERVDDYTLRLLTSLDFVPDYSWENAEDPPHVLFGILTRLCYPVLITAVEPNGLSSANVQAVGYDARVYLDDDSPAP